MNAGGHYAVCMSGGGVEDREERMSMALLHQKMMEEQQALLKR